LAKFTTRDGKDWGEWLADGVRLSWTAAPRMETPIRRWSMPYRPSVGLVTLSGRRSWKASVDWSGVPCEARFWDWKLGPAKAHYL